MWMLEALSFVNSAFNILVYYSMGSRYRDTFWSLCGRQRKDKARSKELTSNMTTTFSVAA
jgi:hypothetical protein